MELEQLRSKLETIFGKKVTAQKDHGEAVRGEAFAAAGATLVVHGELTSSERKLVELLLEDGARPEPKPGGGGTDDERLAAALATWIMERLEQGDHDADLPESFARWPMLAGSKVPLLVYGDYPERLPSSSYADLKKLLKTFFEAEVALIPLHNKMWLILADASLLSEEREGEEESIEEALSALASGLQDMAASEWVGECHVATTYPFSPAGSLVHTVATLRETIELGRNFRLSSNIHLPWELRLETLLDAVPKRAKNRFLEGVLRRAEPSFDPEMLQTLEAFFTENCNVSDTAKRLYIHRNTLLYRLDKFKQETGMDVRDFEHAVLVRLALLLYKVTKRK
ncbi:PucR family transcriptional regulator [Paenibacillus antri]|uniref:PucR family transcriptional regulator n=1 Tax=Paenibacillus antri TaxID=2582848 RepID=A0A5R9G5F2_9BACL|nr:helix-turn-helix domain-containing protein [Paenibacillus antri]TLS49360.1 PucR family transcriptional regulator [Paenibacillus antri]